MLQRLCLLVVTCLVVLAGCDTPQPPASNTPTLVGYWKSPYDGFEVSGTTFTQYADANKAIWFQGTIVGSSPFTSTSGSITLLVTSRPASYGPAVGKYFVARWKALSDKSVKESTPYKTGGLAEADSQEIAETEFTEANGYFSGDQAYALYER